MLRVCRHISSDNAPGGVNWKRDSDWGTCKTQIIAAAGWGEQFIHRTGHGIGMEEHEDPYIVAGNRRPLEPGHAFSVEPGIYVAGRWGMRLEDIVVATAAGPEPLNASDHRLVSVDA